MPAIYAYICVWNKKPTVLLITRHECINMAQVERPCAHNLKTLKDSGLRTADFQWSWPGQLKNGQELRQRLAVIMHYDSLWRRLRPQKAMPAI